MPKQDDRTLIQAIYWFVKVTPIAMVIYSFILIWFAAQPLSTAQTVVDPVILDAYWKPLRNVLAIIYLCVLVLFAFLKRKHPTRQPVTYTSIILSALATVFSYAIAGLVIDLAFVFYYLIDGLQQPV